MVRRNIIHTKLLLLPHFLAFLVGKTTLSNQRYSPSFSSGLWAYRRKLNLEYLYESEKKSHEQEQELNDERLRFYTNITHELRTPLTLILGPLEDLVKSNTLSSKDHHRISVIHQSAVRLLNLINQILDFRKTETQNKRLCVTKAI